MEIVITIAVIIAIALYAAIIDGDCREEQHKKAFRKYLESKKIEEE